MQEHALAEAQNRIQRMEWELQQARQASAAGVQQRPAASGLGGGFFGGLFGGGARPAPPPHNKAPGVEPGPGARAGLPRGYQQAPPAATAIRPKLPARHVPASGSGFLGSALTTAAGVAGGLVAGNALMNLFSGCHGGGFGGAVSAAAIRRRATASHHEEHQSRWRRPIRATSTRAPGTPVPAGAQRPITATSITAPGTPVRAVVLIIGNSTTIQVVAPTVGIPAGAPTTP